MQKVLDFLLDVKESCKVYPLSNEAKSVTNLLEMALNELGVNIYLEFCKGYWKKLMRNSISNLMKQNTKAMIKFLSQMV